MGAQAGIGCARFAVASPGWAVGQPSSA